MREKRGARLVPGPRFRDSMQGFSDPRVLPRDTFLLALPVPLPSCDLFGPPLPVSLPGFALTNGVNWYMRASEGSGHRRLGLGDLTETPELALGVSLEPRGLGSWVRNPLLPTLGLTSQQGTSSLFYLSPSNLVARKSWGPWGRMWGRGRSTFTHPAPPQV